MNIQVRNSSTLKNLDHLRNYVLKHPDQEKISILIDPVTGEMNLPQSLQDFEFLIKKPKMREKRHPEQAKLSIHPTQAGVEFDLVDNQDQKENLRRFSEEAFVVLTETLKILNQMLGPNYHSAKELFSHLDSVKMEDLGSEIQQRPEWRSSIDRSEAEAILEYRPVGTYLLREGDVETREFEENLRSTNAHPFCLFVLTFVEDVEKISDRLLIRRREGWATYDDNPDLNAYSYCRDLDRLLVDAGATIPV